MSLRLLIDEPVNGFVARAIALDHDAVLVVKIGLSGKPDTEVAQRAAELGRLVVTQDRNFARPVIESGERHPGIIVLEIDELTVAERIERVAVVLAETSMAFSGQLTIIRSKTVRRRAL